MNTPTDIIIPETAGNLPGLFLERVRRSPHGCAYKRFDPQGRCCDTFSWQETARMAARWQEALQREGLAPGDRVALMLRNSLEWVLFDLASLGLALVTVPLYAMDRPDSLAFILEESGSRLLLIEGAEQWERISEVRERLDSLVRIVTVTPVCQPECDQRLVELADWLPPEAGGYDAGVWEPGSLATIVYTSGTTGNPKGVMLSHANILSNAHAALQRVPLYPDDLLLSFLPLSHSLERTAGYYAAIMAGACVTHVRSLETIPEDLATVRPTVIVSVPRIFERAHKRISSRLTAGPRWKRLLFRLTVELGWRRFLHRQGRGGWSPLFLTWPLLERLVAQRILDGLGGRVRVAISGGAPLDPEVARLFIAMGLTLPQGYGLTQTSPVVSVNTLDDNLPASVGRPVAGVEVALGESCELLIRGPNVMLGYWRNPAATAAAIDPDGWFHSGDQAGIDDAGHIFITGRLKEIICLSNGEKVPPEELEAAIAGDPLFEQVFVVGEGRPYLAALVVINEQERLKPAGRPGAVLGSIPAERELLARIGLRMARFPGYAQVRRVHAVTAPWDVNDGLMTATLKLRRRELAQRFAAEIEGLYEGH
ncbi:MAG: long-chain fatty acid--CoA ligase [Deltaproteobacteria bacterium]|nr:long-chain fatty acid--CoA ligase [Deltaproteobacteria bacterium]